MVRAFTLLCKLNSFKLSDKVLLDISISHTDLARQTCPFCGSCSNHTIYSSYQRDLISFYEGERHNDTVTIPRIKCHCGHTHAILPDVLIPYGSFSLRFILFVLCDYLTRHCSVEELCLKYQISQSTLYKWIHLFIEHFNLLLGILESINSLSLDALDQICSYEALTYSFFNRFRFSFLQPYVPATFSDTT